MFAVVGCLGLTFLVLSRRAFSGPEVSDRQLIARQVLALDTGNGLFAAPPVSGPGTLDGTVWAVLLQRLLGREGLRPAAGVVADLAADEPAGPWRDLYVSVVGSVARPPGTMPAVDPVPLRLSPIDGDQVKVADDALALWAQTRADGLRGRPPADALAAERWARGVLHDCRANAFVSAQLVEVLETLSQPGDGRQPVPRCAGERPQPAVVPPGDEQELLTLVGYALTAGRDGSDARMARVRAALAPTVEMTYDSWWAYYAARGYLAAGGSPRDFDRTFDGLLRTADEHGLVPTATQPASNLETTHLAVEVLAAAGAELPSHVRDQLVTLPRERARDWSDADWAQWGLTLHTLAIAPSPADRSAVARAAGRCAARQPSPADARTIGQCRAAVRRFGGESPISVDWARWRGESASALIDAAAGLEVSPPRDQLTRAIADLGSNLRGVPTSVLADVSTVARRADLDPDPALQRRIRQEIATRRGPVPFDGLFTEARGDRAPNCFSTLAVLRMENDR